MLTFFREVNQRFSARSGLLNQPLPRCPYNPRDGGFDPAATGLSLSKAMLCSSRFTRSYLTIRLHWQPIFVIDHDASPRIGYQFGTHTPFQIDLMHTSFLYYLRMKHCDTLPIELELVEEKIA